MRGAAKKSQDQQTKRIRSIETRKAHVIHQFQSRLRVMTMLVTVQVLSVVVEVSVTVCVV